MSKFQETHSRDERELLAGSITRDEIVKIARSWLGTPYMHQASKIGVGCDCLGLIRGVWRTLYGDEPEQMPSYTADWAEAKGEETLRDAAARWLTEVSLPAAQAGDVILFRWRAQLPAKHIAIQTSKTTFLHACEGLPVCQATLTSWWRRRLVYVYRFPGVEEEQV